MYIKDCLNICIYSWLGLGSLLLRIEPRGLYPWDIFSWPPMRVSIIDIKVCTFSIGVNSFMISSMDFMVILGFGGGHIFFFYSRFYLLRLRCSFLWLQSFLTECKILKCLSWLYLSRVMNTPCDLNPSLLRVCSNSVNLKPLVSAYCRKVRK